MAEMRRAARRQATETAVRRMLQRKAQEGAGIRAPRRGSHAELLHIQRTQGNEAVERMLRARRRERSAAVLGDGRTASLKVEVADTPEQRREGLRHREELQRDRGLLYLKEPGAPGHTMAGTEVRLSVAYLDERGKVLELREGEPGEGALPPPTYAYCHALEVSRGWFSEKGLGVGSRVKVDGKQAEQKQEVTIERRKQTATAKSGAAAEASAARRRRSKRRDEDERRTDPPGQPGSRAPE